MSVTVCVPIRLGCPHREAAWGWAQNQWLTHHPDWQIVHGHSPEGPFNRAAAIMDAAHKADGDQLVIADSDIWCDPAEALEHLDETGWAIPHGYIHRLSPESTAVVLDGADWRGLPLSTDNAQDRRPYFGNETGTLFVIRADVLTEVPPDPRFVGWGSEDSAHAVALHRLVGKPWRGTDDLVHLWHPPQNRLNRRHGSTESAALLRRYRGAAKSSERMRALIAEFA